MGLKDIQYFFSVPVIELREQIQRAKYLIKKLEQSNITKKITEFKSRCICEHTLKKTRRTGDVWEGIAPRMLAWGSRGIKITLF